jgi:nicotinamidase/pyrazinamidase
MMRFRADDALLVVDIQRDFCSGGSLAIAGADEIIPTINRLIADATAVGATVVACRDWHTENHVSFTARGGPGPPHCVAGTNGAELHPKLRLPLGTPLVSKGTDHDKDEYSAFEGTGLIERLRRQETRRVIICGLALDFCVRASGLQAVQAGFETHVLLAATRPVTQAAGEAAIREMTRAGIVVEKGDPDEAATERGSQKA